MTKQELGKKCTEKGEGKTIKERKINKEGSKREGEGTRIKSYRKTNVTMI